MNRLAILMIASAVAAPAASTATATQTGQKSVEHVRSGKAIDKITCRDFPAIEDRIKSETLSYGIGFGARGHPREAVVDVGDIEKRVPVMVQNSTALPTTRSWPASLQCA